MTLKGQLCATSDTNLVKQALSQGVKVIYLGDIMSPEYSDEFIVSSVLIPDCLMMRALIDGDQEKFKQMYLACLASNPATEMMSIILAALYKGRSIMFYLTQEASGLNYIQYLLQFIEDNYGVVTQTKTRTFTFKPEFSKKVIALLYLNNFVSPQEFLANTEKVDYAVLRKLVGDVHPMVKNPRDLNEIIQWFDHYRDQLLNSDKPLVNGVQYAGEVGDYTGCLNDGEREVRRSTQDMLDDIAKLLRWKK